MPLDHFVSQVHLKNFYAPTLGRRKMYAYRKSNLDTFPCDARDVCRIPEGSTNSFLTEPRLLEEFLKGIEPNYNKACQALSEGRFGRDEVLVIAGFTSFVLGCSPTAMRLGASSLSNLASAEIELLEKMGELLPLPSELGDTSVAELLSSGKLLLETDPKFPQAMGISQIAALTKAFASYRWEVLRNSRADDVPFLTSDFPVALENPGPPAIRVIPLRPDLAVRIHPIIRPAHAPDDLDEFRYRLVDARPKMVREINRSIVQSAEDFIFSPIDTGGIKRLIQKNADIRLDMDHLRVPHGRGYVVINGVRAVKKS